VVLSRRFAVGNVDIALILEPWVQGGEIRGLGGHIMHYHDIALMYGTVVMPFRVWISVPGT
jgi:hypothetical protein